MAVTIVGPGSTTGNTALVSSRSVAVPNNGGANALAAGDVVVVRLSRWESINPAVTAPSGFVPRTQQVNGSSKLNTFLKRLTAADTGTYAFSWTGSMWSTAQARAYRGVDPAANLSTIPMHQLTGSGTAWPAATLSGVSAGALDWHGYSENGGAHVVPTSFTQLSANDCDIGAYRIVAAGSYTTAGGSSVSSNLIVSMLHLPETGGPNLVSGTALASLPAPVGVAAAGRLVLGHAAVTLPRPLASAVGVRRVAGTAATTLPAPVVVASAGRLVLGHAAVTLPSPSAAAAGVRTVRGASVTSLPAPVAVASAGRLVLGTAGAPLPSPAATASGAREVRGTALGSLPAPVAVASAGRLVLGSGTAPLPAPVASAAGSVVGPDVTFASAMLPGPVAVASAGRLVLGAALAALSRPSGTAAGQRTVVGTASAALAGAIGTAFSFVTADGDAPWLTLADLMDARATHESIMLDKVRLYRSGRVAQQPFDPELGYEPSNGPAPYYDGKATVQSKAIQTSTRTIAEQSKSSLGYVVKIPVSAIVIAPEDLVEVTESADPRNVGLWLVVEGAETNTFATARRFSCTVWEGAMRS